VARVEVILIERRARRLQSRRKQRVRDEHAIERPEKGGEASFIRYVVRTATGPASPPLGQGCEL
jgi:hypothetical protein